MAKKYFILLVVMVSVSTACRAQYGASFFYHSKPITPEAISRFLPGVESGDTVRPPFINLKDSVFKLPVRTDTVGTDRWYSCDFDEGNNDHDIISYKIIGRTKDNKFALLVIDNGGGTYKPAYVFIFAVSGTYLYKLGYFHANPAVPTDEIKLYVDEIVDGDFRYKVPK